MLSSLGVWGQITESFEAGLPSSYNSVLSNVTLGSGTWQVRDVIAGTTGAQTGTKSAQIKSATATQIITPTLLGGVGVISFYVTGTTTSGAYQVNISSDNGLTWISAPGSPFTISTSKAFRAITANNGSVNKVQIYRTGATIYVDDFETTTYSSGFAVTYSSNGNTGGLVPTDDTSYTSGATVTVLGNTGILERTGYTFAGWNTAEDGTGISYVSSDTFNITANTTLHAKWKINQYIVNYEGNSNDGGSAPANQTADYNTNITLGTNSGNLTKSGFVFSGWNANATGTGTNYAVSANFTVPASNITLYAKWVSSSPYIITGGTLAGVNTTYGTSSDNSTFTVSAGNLLSNLIITPPSGFEISTTAGSGFTNSLDLGTTEITNTTIYVRLAANTEVGMYNGNAVLSSTGVASVNVTTTASTVSKKILTITGLSGLNKVYDGNAAAALTGIAGLSGVVFSDDVILTGTSNSTFDNKNVGTGIAITTTGYALSGAKAENYNLTQPSGVGNITPKALTITSATAQNKPYDGTTAAAISGPTLVGIISGDNMTVGGGGTFTSPSVGTGISVATNLTLGGTDAVNYSITQPTGLSANIIAIAPTITTSGISISLGGNYTLSGANISSNSAGVFSYSITAGGNATLSGTTITGLIVGSETLTVNQAANGNYTEGSTTVSVLVTLVGYQNGDFRTTGTGVWNNRNDGASTVTWEKYSTITNSWSQSATSPSAMDANVYINNNVEIPTATTQHATSKIIVNNGTTLTFKASNLWTFRNLIIKTGGTLDMQTRFTILAGRDFEIEDGGNFWFNYSANPASSSSLTSTLFNGSEVFHHDSNFVVKNHKTGKENYFLPPAANLTAQTYSDVSAYFGNLIFDGIGDVRLTNINLSGITNYLTHGNLEFKTTTNYNLFYGSGIWIIGKDLLMNSGSSGNLTITTAANTISLNVKGNFINNSDKTFRLVNSNGGNVTLNIDHDISVVNSGVLDLNYSDGGSGTINLKGDLAVGSSAQLWSNNASGATFNFNGNGNGLTAATTQIIDIASENFDENKSINFNIKSGSYVRLANRDFELGTNSKLTVEDGATLDFGFAGNAALNISMSASQTLQSFNAQAGSILKLTSPYGLTKSSASPISGNVQVPINSRIFDAGAIFHYIGRGNQITGNALPDRLTNKLIVELDTQTPTEDDLEFRSTGTTTFGTVADVNGILEIRKGKVIDEPGKGFRNYNGAVDEDQDGEEDPQKGNLLMSGGRYTISGGGTKPNLSGVYTISAGTVEFTGTSVTKIRTSLPAKQYWNVEISGGNVETGGKNFIVNNLLSVTSGGNLTIPDVADSVKPYVVTARKGIQVDEGGKAMFKNNAILMQNTDAANLGNISMERKASVPSVQYNYWSSPVKQQILYSLYPGIPKDKVMIYNSVNDKFVVLPTSTDPRSIFGKGYSIKGSNLQINAPDLVATFVGEPNNETTAGDNIIALSTEGNNYNFIGNPYPSNLDLIALYNDPVNIAKFYNQNDETPTVYFWDNFSNSDLTQIGSGYLQNNYALLNLPSGTGVAAPRIGGSGKKPDAIIKPGQGFIMRASDNGGNLTYKNVSMRTVSVGKNGTYFKDSENRNDRFWLNLTTGNNMNIQISLGYHPEAENSVERFDSYVLSEDVSENFYSLSTDLKKLAIQTRKGTLNIQDVIPIGIKTSKSEIQRISIDEKLGIFENQSIFLKDKMLNIITNLSEGDYQFISVPGAEDSRFEIIYDVEKVLVTDGIVENYISVYRDGEDFIVSSSNGNIESLEVYEVSGKLIYQNYQGKLLIRLHSQDWLTGLYILKIMMKERIIYKKIRR